MASGGVMAVIALLDCSDALTLLLHQVDLVWTTLYIVRRLSFQSRGHGHMCYGRGGKMSNGREKIEYIHYNILFLLYKSVTITMKQCEKLKGKCLFLVCAGSTWRVTRQRWTSCLLSRERQRGTPDLWGQRQRNWTWGRG